MAAASIREAQIVPDPEEMSVAAAYESIKRLMRRDVRYSVEFDDIDGQVIRRFSRTLPPEVWLVARPVNADGKRIAGTDVLVCPIALDLGLVHDERDTLANAMKAELEALKTEDS